VCLFYFQLLDENAQLLKVRVRGHLGYGWALFGKVSLHDRFESDNFLLKLERLIKKLFILLLGMLRPVFKLPRVTGVCIRNW